MKDEKSRRKCECERSSQVVKIRLFAPRGLFTKCSNYERSFEGKVPSQMEEILSGNKSKLSETYEEGSLTLCRLSRPGNSGR